jgi:hypothetical protein
VLALLGRAIAGDLGVPLVQPLPNLVRSERPALPLAPRDDDTRRRDTSDTGQAHGFPPAHATTLSPLTRHTVGVRTAPISLDTAVRMTRTGDLWLFRGTSAADRAIRVTTNSPVNHVGMAVVLDDLPPLMWHAELGQSLVDMWSGQHHRGVQLHDLRDAALCWANKYGQRTWLRQLTKPIDRDAEDALLNTIARLDGTPFPTTGALARGWLRSRVPKRRTPGDAERETAYCAEVVALSYQDMGLLPPKHLPTWYDPGRFWSGDSLELTGGFKLSGEIPLEIPNETPAGLSGDAGPRR